LHEQFRQRIRNPEILLRDYRDIAALLWAIGGFEEELDEAVIEGVEKREINPMVKPDSSVSARIDISCNQHASSQSDSNPTAVNPTNDSVLPRKPRRKAMSGGNR
jgi:hypothetical protein